MKNKIKSWLFWFFVAAGASICLIFAIYFPVKKIIQKQIEKSELWGGGIEAFSSDSNSVVRPSLGVSECDSCILEIRSVREAAPIFKDVSLNSLVVLDVDNVLLVEEDKIFLPQSEQMRGRLFSEAMEKYCKDSPQKMEEAKAVILKQSSMHIPEAEMLSMVRSLQNQCPVICLTACRTGACGDIPSLPDWRIERLKTFGFDFSGAFAEECIVEFPSGGIFKNSPPLFKKGCLFSAMHKKGDVLRVFLDHLRQQVPFWRPSSIVFIDDKLENILSVKECAEALGIRFCGLHYTFCQSFPPCDEMVGQTQIKHLFEKLEWLSEERFSS